VDRRNERRAGESLERDRQPVEVIVDDVEVARALERMRDVQRLPDPSVEGRVFGVAVRAHAVQLRGGLGVERRIERHVDTARVQPGGEQARRLAPRGRSRAAAVRQAIDPRIATFTQPSAGAASTVASTSSSAAVARQIDVSAAP